jgi:hypothetical protein
MRTRRPSKLDADVQRELDAIDAALNARPVSAEHSSLAQLARDVRASRPVARQQFLAELDARAAEGFQRAGLESAPPRRSSRRLPERLHKAWRRPSLRVLSGRPAVGLALAALLAVAVVVPLALSGGGRAHQAVPSARIAMGQAQEASPVPSQRATERKSGATEGAAGASVASAAPARQVEHAASLDLGLAPNSIESTAHRVFTLVSGLGGYVRQSNVSSGGPGQGGASFDIRVPSSNLTNAIAALSALGHVRSENDSTNDVTDQFNSLQRSLAGLKAELAGVRNQLAHVSEAKEEASLRDRLRYLEARVAREDGALQALSARVNYTALALSLTPESVVGSKHGELTPGAAARDARKILEAALSVLVLAAAVLLPVGVIALAAWVLIASARRRMREQALDVS